MWMRSSAVARACVAIGRLDRLAIVLNAWKATAEDPHPSPTGDDLDYLDHAEAVPDPRDPS